MPGKNRDSLFSDIGTQWPRSDGPDPSYCGEDERLAVLASHGLDALVDDPELESLTRFAAHLCGAPISTVSMVEEERQHFVAREGIEEHETPRSVSFCAQAMLQNSTMVVTDASSDPRFSANPLVTGPMNIRFYAGAPLFSREGAPMGALCVIDRKARPEGLTELQREGLETLAQAVTRRLDSRRQSLEAERAIARETRRLRQMAEHIPVLAWAATKDDGIEFGNAALYEFCGSDDPASIDFEDLLHPEDAEKLMATRTQAREEGTRWEGQARVRRGDGTYRWLLMRAWPMRNSEGEIETWFGAGIDIDDAYRLSESRDLLARELSHRIKNIFAVVTGLVAIKSRQYPEAKQFATEMAQTIRSLGLAHDYVRPVEGRRGENLSGLLADLLAPYQDAKSQRIQVRGGNETPLGSRAATPLALVFHELATNSAKYGALSCEDGRIEIDIDDDAGSDEDVTITWREFSKPCEVIPDVSQEGFGSRLLRMAVEGQLGGRFRREFARDGMTCEIAVPRSDIAR